MARNIRIAFTRNEICSIIDALDSLAEDYKYDGGLRLIEDELALRDRLAALLRRRDYREPDGYRIEGGRVIPTDR